MSEPLNPKLPVTSLLRFRPRVRRAYHRLAFSAGLLGWALPSARAQSTEPAARAPEQPAPRLTKPPKLVTFVEAPYPEREKLEGRTAAVVLELAISSTGRVTDAQVLESAGSAFDEAALAAAREFAFEPAEVDGVAAPIRINYRYEFSLEPAPAPAAVNARFSGLVRLRGSGQPLSGVKVELDDGRHAVTDERGHFEIDDVASGPHMVTLSGAALTPVQTEQRFDAGAAVVVSYDVELPAASADGSGDDLEIVIWAPAPPRLVASTKVEATDAKRVAGTQGDVLKIVENMPGVARAAAGSGEVVVWGASPEDTRVYVDGVRVPLLYHFGGLRSTVHTDLVKNVELIPGGYGVAYGRGLGGLVSVETREPNAERARGSIGLDVLDAAAAVNGPVGGKFSAAAAVRRSHLAWLLERVSDENLGEFFPIPHYYDAQARVRYRASDDEWLELGGLLSSDSVSRTANAGDPSNAKRETKELYFDRLALAYHRRHADGAETALLPWLGRNHSRLSSRFGGAPSELEVRSSEYGLRASHRARTAPFLSVTAGLDLAVSDAAVRRVGSITTPAREGDARVFGQPPSDQSNVDDWRVLQLSGAPYVEADFALLGDALHVVPGLRLENFVSSVSRRTPPAGALPRVGAFLANTELEPRVALRYALSPRVSLKAAYGRYHQAALPEELSAIFGNPTLGASAATHWLGGGSFRLFERLNLETTVFYSRSRELVVRNASSAPLAAEALVNEGQGRSYGAQFLLRRESKSGFFGWVAYTLLRSERRDAGARDWRLFDFDQTHVLTALASYALAKGFDVGARFRCASGYPRTAVVGAYRYTRSGLYQPILGAHNGVRIPSFAQLDVRVSKRLKLAETELELYLDVQNVTNRENAEELAYNSDYSERRTIRGLPILPVLGAKWDF